MGWRLDPLAVAIDAGEVVDGSDDGVGIRANGLRALDDVSEGEAEVAVALVVEVDCFRVPVDGAWFNAIVLGDVLDAVPVNELFLDGFAEWIPADQAEALVVIDWDAHTFLHEGEFLILSQGTFAARTLLVFFLGLWRRRIGHGWRGRSGDGWCRLRRWFGWRVGCNGARRGIVYSN